MRSGDNMMVISREDYACLQCDLEYAKIKAKQWQSIAEKLAEYLEEVNKLPTCCRIFEKTDRAEWLLKARKELGIKGGKTGMEKFIEAVKAFKKANAEVIKEYQEMTGFKRE